MKFLCLLLVLSSTVFSKEKIADTFLIQIDEPRDYAVLREFFKKGFLEEEDYGYVLAGVKPISVRNFQAKDSFLIPNHLDWELLVHEAIPIWNRLCGQGRQFVFKTVLLPDSESIAPGFELQFINVSKLREVVHENIDLFRFALGPLTNTEQLVNRIAFSSELLNDVLKNDLSLLGIVLGFGFHNSLIGGKMDAIAASVLTRDKAPFLPRHHFFQNTPFLLSEDIYRLYYLEFAGGDDRCFKERDRLVSPESNFSEWEEQLREFAAKEEALPTSLQTENPRFVFSAFKGGRSNKKLFNQLEKAQKWVQQLMQRGDFFEAILEKISGKKPIISCDKPDANFPLFKTQEGHWIELLSNVASHFEKEGSGAAFINAFCLPAAPHQRPWAVGVSQATLRGLARAKANLAKANDRFDRLSKKTDLQTKEVIKGLLYAETSLKGTGKKLPENIDYIRAGYIVEDADGDILFADYDSWIQLRKTLPAFSHALSGMQIGETRTLFIHPSLAYGALSTLPPCTSLTIKIRLLDFDAQKPSQEPLSPLKPLDLSWVNDPRLYENLRASIDQIPSYVGAFYRHWLEKRSGLNLSLVSESLKKNFAAMSQEEEAVCGF